MELARKQLTRVLQELFPSEKILLEQPPDPALGDFAFACFWLAKTLRKSPNQIAEELKTTIKLPPSVQRVEAKGGYLNFFLDKAQLAKEVIEQTQKKKEAYGKGVAKKEKVMVEFFQANTHKAVHVGHCRNMCLGISLSNILAFSGFPVLRANYQGDIGPHVVKCLWGLMRRGENPPATGRLRWLGEIYSWANQEISGSEQLEQQIREMTKRLYDGDKELTKLWKETRQWCLEDFQKLYAEFGVTFDHLFFESEVEPKGKALVEEMRSKGLAVESEGALVIDLEKEGLGVFLLLRSDGVALYSTKDLALAREKFQQYKIDRSIYVVGSEQELYFKQLFKTLELMGFAKAKQCFHLSYGLVMLPEGKMSSRQGTVVLYEDLKDKLLEASRNGVTERHKEWSEQEVDCASKMLAFSAMKFAMLLKENNRSMVFDWDSALDFEGETGPYVQYAHARICSIFRKHGKKIPKTADYSELKTAQEEKMISLVSAFPEIVADAAEHYRPHVVARFVLELAQSFNEFYHVCPILQEEKPLMEARLVLIGAVKQVLANGLSLLGIEAPEQM